MKIQISPIKKVDDAMVIWHEETPDVDLTLDIRPPYKLGFKKNSVKVIYVFGLLGITPLKDISALLKNLTDILEVGGEIYLIEQDMDYILRAMLAGDLSIDEFNREYTKKTYFNQDLLVKILEKAGFPDKEQVWWQENQKFEKKGSEIIIMGKKNNKQ